MAQIPARASAYLDGVPAAARAASAAAAHMADGRAVFIWAVCGLILFALVRTGSADRLQRALGAILGPIGRSLVATLCVAALFCGLAAAAGAAADALWPSGHARAGGLADVLGDVAFWSLFGGGSLFAALYAVGRWPVLAPLALTAAAAAAIFGLVLVSPVTLVPANRHDQPARADQAAAHGAALLAFVRQGGLAARRLDVFPSRDPAAVDMEGLGPNVHAAVSAAALEGPTPQTYAAIGHLLGHYVHHDLWWMALLWWAMATLAAAAAGGLAGPLARRHRPPGSRTAHRSGVPDASLAPASALVVWALIPIADVGFNLFDQVINYRADAYALALTHDPDGLCRWIVADDQGGPSDPSALEALLFFNHPPLQRRLEAVLR